MKPEKFWTECIWAGVCTSISSLDFDEMERLERKSGEITIWLGGEGQRGHSVTMP